LHRWVGRKFGDGRRPKPYSGTETPGVNVESPPGRHPRRHYVGDRMSKWIAFKEVGRKSKTKVFEVRTKAPKEPYMDESGILLGEVCWTGRWRQYAFFPEAGMMFERQCLRDIADFCESETKKHRARAA